MRSRLLGQLDCTPKCRERNDEDGSAQSDADAAQKKPGLASRSPGRMTHRREEESGEKYEANRSSCRRQASSMKCNAT